LKGLQDRNPRKSGQFKERLSSDAYVGNALVGFSHVRSSQKIKDLKDSSHNSLVSKGVQEDLRPSTSDTL